MFCLFLLFLLEFSGHVCAFSVLVLGEWSSFSSEINTPTHSSSEVTSKANKKLLYVYLVYCVCNVRVQ